MCWITDWISYNGPPSFLSGEHIQLRVAWRCFISLVCYRVLRCCEANVFKRWSVNLCLYTLGGNTSYRQSPESERLSVIMIYRSEIWQVSRQSCCRSVKFQSDWKGLGPNLAASKLAVRRPSVFFSVNRGLGVVKKTRKHIWDAIFDSRSLGSFLQYKYVQ